ncbi:M48 family metalloprotease [Natranaerofaba carboxydovora]|uniref:M48 family metalloprotease n=1 Tax=Natranaerofaba carboxydovora TaxID=2742683 RepID=UPI001F133392|nr:M48 family metalloprotease [Natranaerofaba carboxydovora]UMZ73023.1 Protease HtpX [Natranaerofaba carboxydovora]
MKYFLLGVIALINWFIVSLVFSPFTQYSFILSILVMAAVVGAALSPVGESIVRVLYRAEELPQHQKNRIDSLWNEVKKESEINLEEFNVKPEFFMLNDNFVNAFALGSNTVIFTRGFLSVSTDEEFKGILAHELGHLVNHDTKVLLAALLMNIMGQIGTTIIVFFTSAMAFVSSLFGEEAGCFISIPLAIFSILLNVLSWIIYNILELSLRAVGRQNEFYADEFAKKCGQGRGLAKFLHRVSSIESEAVENKETLASRLLNTHPPIDERLNKLGE